MSHRQDEPVTVRPNGIAGIELHDSLPETVGDWGHGHRRTRMTRIGLLYGIHGQGADRIDTGLIKLCVGHHGPLCRGVSLEVLSFVVLVSIYVGLFKRRLK